MKLWDEPLPPLKNLKSFHGNPLKGLPITEIGTDCLSLKSGLDMLNMLIPCLLTERGFYTNQAYIGNLNHRQLQHFVINNKHSKGPSLKESFATPNLTDGADSFSSGTMIVVPHGLSHNSDDFSIEIVSQCPNKLPNSNDQLNATCGDRWYKPLSPDVFSRALEFFGYRWTDNSNQIVSREPTPYDVLEFLKLFSDIRIEDNDSFEKFIHEFSIGERFMVDRKVCVITNLNRFGWLLRSFLSLRFTPCEGQHRWWCLSGFAQGFITADGMVPIKQQSLGDYDIAFRDIRRWQIHNAMSVKICIPDATSQEVQADCKKLSLKLTQQQGTTVDFSFAEMLSSLCRDVHLTLWSQHGMESLTFDNFWSKSVPFKETSMFQNFKHLMAIADGFIGKNDSYNKQSVLFKRGQSFAESRDLWEAEFSKGLAFGTDSRNVMRCSMMLISLLKALCDNNESFSVFPSLHSRMGLMPLQRHEQQTSYAFTFCDAGFFQHVHLALGPCSEIISQKLILEVHTFDLFVANVETIHESDFSDGFISRPDPTMQKYFDLEDANAKLVKVTKSKLSVGSFQSIQKVELALNALLIRDLFEFMNNKGYDHWIFPESDIEEAARTLPADFFRPGKHNYCLKLYLSKRYEGMRVFQHRYKKDNIFWRTRGNSKCVDKSPHEEPTDNMPVLEDRKNVPKYTFMILLELLPFYIFANIYPYERRLSFLKPFIGKRAKDRNTQRMALSTNKRLVLHDVAHGFPIAFRDQLQRLSDINNQRILLSQMAADIESGVFDTDSIGPFVDHIQKELSIAIWPHSIHGQEKEDEYLTDEEEEEEEASPAKPSTQTPSTPAPSVPAATTPATEDKPEGETPKPPPPSSARKTPVSAETKDPIKQLSNTLKSFSSEHSMPTSAKLKALYRLAVNLERCGRNDFLKFVFALPSELQNNSMGTDMNDYKALMNHCFQDLGRDPIYPTHPMTAHPYKADAILVDESVRFLKVVSTPKTRASKKRAAESSSIANTTPLFGVRAQFAGAFNPLKLIAATPSKCSNPLCNNQRILDKDHLCFICSVNFWCDSKEGCYEHDHNGRRDVKICVPCAMKEREEGRIDDTPGSGVTPGSGELKDASSGDTNGSSGTSNQTVSSDESSGEPAAKRLKTGGSESEKGTPLLARALADSMIQQPIPRKSNPNPETSKTKSDDGEVEATTNDDPAPADFESAIAKASQFERGSTACSGHECTNTVTKDDLACGLCPNLLCEECFDPEYNHICNQCIHAIASHFTNHDSGVDFVTSTLVQKVAPKSGKHTFSVTKTSIDEAGPINIGNAIDFLFSFKNLKILNDSGTTIRRRSSQRASPAK